MCVQLAMLIGALPEDCLEVKFRRRDLPSDLNFYICKRSFAVRDRDDKVAYDLIGREYHRTPNRRRHGKENPCCNEPYTCLGIPLHPFHSSIIFTKSLNR